MTSEYMDGTTKEDVSRKDAASRAGFSFAISLNASWPIEISDPERSSIRGKLRFASAYLSAAETLRMEAPNHGDNFHLGPVLQNLGLAAELILKTMAAGKGLDEKELRALGHSSYKAYCACLDQFNEVSFIESVTSNTAHLKLPDEVLEMFSGQPRDAEMEWRCFFQHLRILDEIYDRPFRTRYAAPGQIVLPEPYIVLVGLKILHAAMEERIG